MNVFAMIVAIAGGKTERKPSNVRTDSIDDIQNLLWTHEQPSVLRHGNVRHGWRSASESLRPINAKLVAFSFRALQAVHPVRAHSASSVHPLVFCPLRGCTDIEVANTTPGTVVPLTYIHIVLHPLISHWNFDAHPRAMLSFHLADVTSKRTESFSLGGDDARNTNVEGCALWMKRVRFFWRRRNGRGRICNRKSACDPNRIV